jgi:hypothetical protein
MGWGLRSAKRDDIIGFQRDARAPLANGRNLIKLSCKAE